MSQLRGIILLDGPDGSGKSTLSAELARQVTQGGGTAQVIHSGLRADGDYWRGHAEVLTEAARGAFSGDSGVVILDRFFLSESIYGDVYRGASYYPTAVRHLDRLLQRFGALHVVCAPPVKYVKETHARLVTERQEDFLTSMDVVSQRYLDLWHGAAACEVGSFLQAYTHGEYTQQLCLLGGVKNRRRWYHYDVTVDGADLAGYAAQLLGQLRTEQTLTDDRAMDLAGHCFTGSASAAVLLVGDQLSHPTELSVPFFANDGCSLYLAETLQALAADESEVCVANVNDPGGVATVKWLAAGKRVIALGREAEKTLTAHDIPPDAAVRHPQHARRFTSQDDSYIVELRQAFYGLAGVTKA